MAEPTVLRVEETGSVELVAVAARLHVTVAGTGGWFASAAEARSAEVRALTAALGKAGVAEDEVELRGVTFHDEAGMFGRNTRARYTLRVRVDGLDRLGDVLTVLSEQKNASLDRISWRFDEEAGRRTLAARLIATARARADVMAEALGQRVVAVRSVSDRPASGTYESRSEGVPAPASKAGANPGLTTLGTRTLVHAILLEVDAG